MVAELKKVAITSVFILDLKASLSAAQLLTLDSPSVVAAAAEPAFLPASSRSVQVWRAEYCLPAAA